MGRMYHRSSGAHIGQKAWLATPSYSGVGAGYAWSLSSSILALSQSGIGTEPAIFDGDCHVDDARNRLVRDFLESDCTDLVFLDADMRWEPRDLVKLLKHDRDVVGATYPLKQEEDSFPVEFFEGEMWADEDGLIMVKRLPTGFLRIRRCVLERLAEKAPHFMPKSDQRSPIPLIFERTMKDKARVGGDYTFCDKWQALGGKVYVDPEIALEHAGEHQWTGSLGHFQRVKMYGGMKAGIMEIRHRLETPETFADMCKAWGNSEFSVLGDFLAVAVVLARNANGPIFEAGSGLTTIVIGATDKAILALENNNEWIKRVSEHGPAPLHTEIKNGWYDLPDMFRRHFALAVIDGPARDIGDRSHFLKSGITADAYLIDDADWPPALDMAKQLGEVVIMGTHRPFAIVRSK